MLVVWYLTGISRGCFAIFNQEHGLSIWEQHLFISQFFPAFTFSQLLFKNLPFFQREPAHLQICSNPVQNYLSALRHTLFLFRCPVLQFESISSHSNCFCALTNLLLTDFCELTLQNSPTNRMQGTTLNNENVTASLGAFALRLGGYEQLIGFL